jgi:hypothetical protein
MGQICTCSSDRRKKKHGVAEEACWKRNIETDGRKNYFGWDK